MSTMSNQDGGKWELEWFEFTQSEQNFNEVEPKILKGIHYLLVVNIYFSRRQTSMYGRNMICGNRKQRQKSCRKFENFISTSSHFEKISNNTAMCSNPETVGNQTITSPFNSNNGQNCPCPRFYQGNTYIQWLTNLLSLQHNRIGI